MANKYANLIGTNLIKDEYTKINTGFDAVEAEVTSHKAENTSQVIRATRDLSLEGKQTISTLPNRQIRGIIVFANINTTLATSFGMWGSNSQGSIYARGDNGQSYSGPNALFLASGSVSTSSTLGTISNVINGSFDLDWAKVGNGATGIANLRIFVLYHD